MKCGDCGFEIGDFGQMQLCVNEAQDQVLVLESRMKELEAERDRQHQLKDSVEHDLQSMENENARLRKQIDGLTWFRDRAIERTVPGTADTTDAVHELIQDLRKTIDAARELILCQLEHDCGQTCDFCLAIRRLDKVSTTNTNGSKNDVSK